MTASDVRAAEVVAAGTHPYVRRMLGGAYPDEFVTLGYYSPTCDGAFCHLPAEFGGQVLVHSAECVRRRRDFEWSKWADAATQRDMAKSLTRGPRPHEARQIDEAEYGWARDAELDSRRAAAARGAA